MSVAGAAVQVECDTSRVLALLSRIERMDDAAMRLAAFKVYEALHGLGQAFETEVIEFGKVRATVVVHPSAALRRCVDALIR